MEIEIWHISTIGRVRQEFYVGRDWSWPDAFKRLQRWSSDLRWTIHRIDRRTIQLRIIWGPYRGDRR